MAGRTVFVVLVAVGLALLVLRNAFDDGSASSGGGSDAGASTTTSLLVDETTTTTAAAVDPAGFVTIVANGSGVAGSAGKWTDGLQTLGFNMLPATNARQSGQGTTVVYYVFGSDPFGAYVADVIGATSTQPWPTDNPPVLEIGNANVIVVLGQDLANQTPPTALPGEEPAAADTTSPPTT